MLEREFQRKVVQWLREKGAYVIKTPGGVAGIPTGCPDVIALFPNDFWVALEVKASKTAKKQPLQQATIDKLDSMGYARFVHPTNWAKIRREIQELIIVMEIGQ